MRGNKLFQQPICNSITSIIYVCVCVKHLKVSAVKNKYYIKKHCSCRCRVYNNRWQGRLLYLKAWKNLKYRVGFEAKIPKSEISKYNLH